MLLKNLKMALLVIALTASGSSWAVSSMKDLVREALLNGKAEDVLSDKVSDVFKLGTKSTMPVSVKLTKIESYQDGCGRLHAQFSQQEIKDKEGNPITEIPWFEFSICPNGQPPKETELAENARKLNELKKCVTKITQEPFDKKTKSTLAEINLQGCPANGKSYWVYTGDCDKLKMNANQSVIYPFDTKGALTFKVQVPAQCSAVKNSWTANIQEAAKPGVQGIGGLVVIGSVRVDWPKEIKPVKKEEKRKK